MGSSQSRFNRTNPHFKRARYFLEGVAFHVMQYDNDPLWVRQLIHQSQNTLHPPCFLTIHLVTSEAREYCLVQLQRRPLRPTPFTPEHVDVEVIKGPNQPGFCRRGLVKAPGPLPQLGNEFLNQVLGRVMATGKTQGDAIKPIQMRLDKSPEAVFGKPAMEHCALLRYGGAIE